MTLIGLLDNVGPLELVRDEDGGSLSLIKLQF